MDLFHYLICQKRNIFQEDNMCLIMKAFSFESFNDRISKRNKDSLPESDVFFWLSCSNFCGGNTFWKPLLVFSKSFTKFAWLIVLKKKKCDLTKYGMVLFFPRPFSVLLAGSSGLLLWVMSLEYNNPINVVLPTLHNCELYSYLLGQLLIEIFIKNIFVMKIH